MSTIPASLSGQEPLVPRSGIKYVVALHLLFHRPVQRHSLLTTSHLVAFPAQHATLSPMALRAAVARHVLGLTLRREFSLPAQPFATTSRRASSSAAAFSSSADDGPSASSSSHLEYDASRSDGSSGRRTRRALPANDWYGALHQSADSARASKELVEGFSRAPREDLTPFAPPEPPPKRKRPRKGWKTPAPPTALQPEWQTAMANPSHESKRKGSTLSGPRGRPTSQAKQPLAEGTEGSATGSTPGRWPVTPAKPWYRQPLRVRLPTPHS